MPPRENAGELTRHYENIQAALYSQIKTLFEGVSPNGGETQSAINFVGNHLQQIGTSVTPNIVIVDGQPSLQSVIPILTNDVLEATRVSLEKENFGTDNLMVAFAAALIVEARAPNLNVAITDRISLSVVAEVGNYSGWRAVEDFENEETSRISQVRKQIQVSLDDITGQAVMSIDALRQTYANSTSAIEADVASLADRTNQALEAAKIASDKATAFEGRADELIADVDARSTDISEKFDASNNKVEAFMEAVRTQANFEDLKIHWVNRGRTAAEAWFWSGTVLLVLLVVVPGFAIYDSEIVVAFMKKLVDAAAINIGPNPDAVTITVATISRLVVITIPLALYFWLIRLVVRYNMRSMLLMDDARQRATMLETYYRMIERSAATVEDRALVLQALMRPAPGHESDSIDPPNFSEVVEKAMGRT